MSRSALQLLQEAFTCDGHADTFRKVALEGGDFLTGEGGHHLSLPRLREVRQNLQIMAIYIPHEESGPLATVSALRIALEALRATDRSGGQLGMVTDKASLEAAARSDHPWIMLSIEGADPLNSDLNLLEVFFRFGVRAIGLTHNHNSCAAGGCNPPDGVRQGLSAFGRELLPEMKRLGMLVDTAHLGRQAFDEVLERAGGPVVNSHSCCECFISLERNLSDSQLKALAATGGLAAVTFVPRFLRDDAAPTSADVFRHLEHMVEVAGIDHVAVGSDFDGVDQLPSDLGQPAQMVNLVERMFSAGWAENDVRKVVGENWKRVLGRVLP